MTLRVVELPRTEEGLARFADVAERARAADPVLGAGPPDDDARVLLPSSDEGGAVPMAWFVAEEDGVDVARCAAMAPGHVPCADDGTAGAVGFWASVAGHEAAALGVLEAARDWLFARGLDAVGPLDLSTWHRYRFVVEGFDNGRFLLEPWNRPDEVALWERAGFSRALQHATVEAPLLEVPVLAEAHAQALAMGIRFTDMGDVPPEAALGALYDVVRAGFAGKSGFADVPRDRFFSLYAGASLLISPGLSFLAVDRQDRPLGFAFSYPDWLEPLRSAHADPTTTVVKTLARTPDAPAWLGYALVHQHVASARERGFSTVLFALMERWAALARVVRSQGAPARVWKRYALFRSNRRPS